MNRTNYVLMAAHLEDGRLAELSGKDRMPYETIAAALEHQGNYSPGTAARAARASANPDRITGYDGELSQRQKVTFTGNVTSVVLAAGRGGRRTVQVAKV